MSVAAAEAWRHADVRTTEAGARRAARFHWPDPSDRAMCSGLPLTLFGEIAGTVAADRRCRANGCRQQWANYDEAVKA